MSARFVAFYHMRALKHIWPALTEDMAKSVACALVGSRLDCANSVLHGAPANNIARSQLVQNALARVVLRSPSVSTTLNLQQLHWLLVQCRIRFKVATIAYKAHVSSAPRYLTSLIRRYKPAHPLRSSGANLLERTRVKTEFGARSFSVAAPTIWNELPDDCRSATSLHTFRRRLKTHYFATVFSQSIETCCV